MEDAARTAEAELVEAHADLARNTGAHREWASSSCEGTRNGTRADAVRAEFKSPENPRFR